MRVKALDADCLHAARHAKGMFFVFLACVAKLRASLCPTEQHLACTKYVRVNPFLLTAGMIAIIMSPSQLCQQHL